MNAIEALNEFARSPITRRLFEILKGQIITYVEDFICGEFLEDGEYPRWREELSGDELKVDDFLDNIIHQTINSEDYEYTNMRYFEIPSTCRNAHGLILKCISLCGRDGYDDEFKISDKCMFDGDRACMDFAFWWLNSNRDWLKDMLDEYSSRCGEEEDEEELGEEEDEDDEDDEDYENYEILTNWSIPSKPSVICFVKRGNYVYERIRTEDAPMGLINGDNSVAMILATTGRPIFKSNYSHYQELVIIQ